MERTCNKLDTYNYTMNLNFGIPEFKIAQNHHLLLNGVKDSTLENNFHSEVF